MRLVTKSSITAMVLAGVAAGGAIVATSGTADEPPTVRAAAPLPPQVMRMVGDPSGFTAAHGIDPSKALRVELPDGGSGELRVTSGDGGAVCITRNDGANACATGEEVAEGRLTLAVLPPMKDAGAGAVQVPSRLNYSDPKAVASTPTPAAPQRERGSGTYLGYVTDDVTTATLLDPGGRVIGSSPVANNVYEIPIADASVVRPARIDLRRRDGSKLTVEL